MDDRPDAVARPQAPRRRAWLHEIPVKPVALSAALLAAMVLPNYLANPGRGAEPYGGCDEGWAQGYLHGDGATWCRAHGWLLEKDLLVAPDGTVVADGEEWHVDFLDRAEMDRDAYDGW